MKLTPFFLLVLFSFSLWAQTPPKNKPCVIISGAKIDHNNVFDLPMYKQDTINIGNHNCTIVDGWTEAVLIAEMLPPGDLLIVQGTHGGSDGTFACNSGDATADEVLTNLNRLSKRHKVGAAIDSCFSGEIMRKKLIADVGEETKNLENLCLVTSSQLGRITYGGKNDLSNVLSRAKAGQTLEQIFLESNSGMISSAAWSEAGIPQYLMNKTAQLGMNVLQKVDAVTRFDGVCDTKEEANAAICASPSVSNEVFQLLMGFTDVSIKDENKAFFLKNIKAKPDALTKAKKTGYEDGVACFKGLLDFYQNKYGPELELLSEVTQLVELEKEFTSMRVYPLCEKYKQTLISPWEQKALYYSTLFNTKDKYIQDQTKLSQIFSTHNFMGEFDMMSFAKAAAGDKSVCKPEDKMQILQSMLGEQFFPNEYSEYSIPNQKMVTPDETILGKELSTQIAMKGFQDASIRRNRPGNKTDEARAKACKNFKI